jgi:hypothetical protein
MVYIASALAVRAILCMGSGDTEKTCCVHR